MISKIITYNYNEFGNEFGDALVDLKNENEHLQEENQKLNKIIDEANEYINDTYMFDYEEEERIELKEQWYAKDLLNILNKLTELKKEVSNNE